MKLNVKIFIYIVVLLLVITGVIAHITRSDSKKVSEAFLKEFYTINMDEKEAVKAQYETYDASERMIKQIEVMHHVYDPLLTADGFQIILMNRYIVAKIEAAAEKPFTVAVSNIQLEASLSEPDHVVYNYAVTLELQSAENEHETVTETGYVNLLKVDRKWKIDKLRLGIDAFKND
ncbi:hypothetical protein KHM83_17490 [Fusibacter paucivorans]|uniref:SnoaL-like domain-containing protein n=1 Tax=Fusibacter paucivorans TaxID=76009 RepID=A0ABS5PVF0_9FIRM|nr:hypothetical protein [Fusibacter paucivorans]MBS7528484.1 hypothetical protein [Fusibacter paucivorans]